MAIDPRKRFLHVACRDRQKLVSYRIDPTTGGLSLIGSVPLQGEPIQIVTDPYRPVSPLGLLLPEHDRVHAISDAGVIAFPPIEWRYTAYGCHGIEVDPSNRFVFVPPRGRSGGPNAVAQFKFDRRPGGSPQHPPSSTCTRTRGRDTCSCIQPCPGCSYSADEQGAVQRPTASIRRRERLPTFRPFPRRPAATRPGHKSRAPSCSSLPTGSSCSWSPGNTTASPVLPSTRRAAGSLKRAASLPSRVSDPSASTRRVGLRSPPEAGATQAAWPPTG